MKPAPARQIRRAILLAFPLAVFLSVFLPEIVLGHSGIIDVTQYGAVGDGNPKKADQNTEAIKKAWNAAASVAQKQNGGILYFPPGVYCVKKLGAKEDGFLPLRTANIQGAGPQISVLKLADNQNTHLLEIRGNTWFDASISEIGFNGNKKHNQKTDVLIELDGYNMQIRNTYISQSGGSGLRIFNTQQVRVSQVDIEFNEQWGLISENNLSITFDSVSCEFNNAGGLLIKSRWRSLPDDLRYMAPSTVVTGGYFEKSPIGIELRGICGVEVHSGFSTATFLKITTDPESGKVSTGNIIYAQGAIGNIEIDQGNYGNTVFVGPMTKNRMSIVDRDGRNYIGPPGKAYSETDITLATGGTPVGDVRDMSKWKTTSTGQAKWELIAPDNRSDSVRSMCGEKTPYYELTLPDKGRSVISRRLDNLETSSSYVVRSLLNIYGSYKIYLTLFDFENMQFYNWNIGQWESTQSLMPVEVNGSIQLHEFHFKTDERKRKIRIEYQLFDGYGQKGRFYCTDIRKL